ncbi:MAG: glycosyltransferase family 2 protein [Pyrinomonadaceae bacterium]
MLNGKKIIVVMPAFNAARTLERTYRELPFELVDDVLLVDDASHDATVELSRSLGLTTILHEKNMGYGRNQKTCYREALARGADIVVMVHPDYQYSPKLVTSLVAMIAFGEYDVVLASRILGNGALDGGMPRYKYVANRFLTAFQNLMIGQKLSEYHTGYRAFRREVLESLPLEENTNDFLFDNEVLAQIVYFKFRIGEISCPTRYFAEASSINFSRSLKYGLGVVITSIKFRLQKMRLGAFRIFASDGPRLVSSTSDAHHQSGIPDLITDK